jgi:hypothetical protein
MTGFMGFEHEMSSTENLRNISEIREYIWTILGRHEAFVTYSEVVCII